MRRPWAGPGRRWCAGLNRQAGEANRAREQSGVSEARGRPSSSSAAAVVSREGRVDFCGLLREDAGSLLLRRPLGPRRDPRPWLRDPDKRVIQW